MPLEDDHYLSFSLDHGRGHGQGLGGGSGYGEPGTLSGPNDLRQQVRSGEDEQWRPSNLWLWPGVSWVQDGPRNVLAEVDNGDDEVLSWFSVGNRLLGFAFGWLTDLAVHCCFGQRHQDDADLTCISYGSLFDMLTLILSIYCLKKWLRADVLGVGEVPGRLDQFLESGGRLPKSPFTSLPPRLVNQRENDGGDLDGSSSGRNSSCSSASEDDEAQGDLDHLAEAVSDIGSNLHCFAVDGLRTFKERFERPSPSSVTGTSVEAENTTTSLRDSDFDGCDSCDGDNGSCREFVENDENSSSNEFVEHDREDVDGEDDSVTSQESWFQEYYPTYSATVSDSFRYFLYFYLRCFLCSSIYLFFACLKKP